MGELEVGLLYYRQYNSFEHVHIYGGGEWIPPEHQSTLVKI